VIPELFPLVKPYLLRTLQGESIADLEISKPSHKPGVLDLTLLLSFQPVYDEARELAGVSVATVDISERKRAEGMLLEMQRRERNGEENRRPSRPTAAPIYSFPSAA
jgi:hypothetical protein